MLLFAICIFFTFQFIYMYGIRQECCIKKINIAFCNIVIYALE